MLRFLAITAYIALAGIAQAYPVGPALSLEELAKKADLVCKAEVVSSEKVADDSFREVRGFPVRATRLKIIAVYKGEAEGEIEMRHYGPAEGMQGIHYMPQHYRFEVGRTYLVFAKATTTKGVVRQLRDDHTLQEDQGVVLAADQSPHRGATVPDIVWRELTGLLKSERPEDVVYGLAHLDEMSGGSYFELKDFDRVRVLEAAAPLLAHREEQVVKQVIRVLSSNNPYMSPDYAPGWLATIGKGDIQGYGAWDLTRKNLGGEKYWKELAAVGEGTGSPAVKAMAVRAMGLGRRSEILERAVKWSREGEPLVRQAAVWLLADYPKQADQNLIKAACRDPEPLVRTGGALAIGYGQFAELVPELDKLLDDDSKETAKYAALSLLSFSAEHNRKLLQRRAGHAEYGVLFVNALAREDVASYLPELAEIVRQNREPHDWWGGRIPWGVSWDLLFRYAARQTKEDPNAAELSKVLDALEYPAAADPQGPAFYSSSEPRDLYALYVQRGMTARARKFRAACKQALSYDIDYFFDMVDKNPGQYERK